MPAPASAFARLLEVLDRMEIPYAIGGSVASSAHGIPQTTLDVDLIISAEDTVLGKLEWYRAGGETSERQWNDLLGVRRTVNRQLDLAYLRRWAPDLEVADLLERLLAEAGL